MLARLFSRVFPTWQNALLAVLGAVLLILAFPDFDWWFLAWFALVPLMWAVEREKESTLRSFVTGWLFGTVFFFGTCWWLTFAPINYAGFPWWLAYFLLLCVCLVVGLFPAMFAGILSILHRRFGLSAIFAAPIVWVFTEFLRYWLTGNNWNAIGYSQSSNSALGWAPIGGVLLVSFVVGFYNLVALAFVLNAVDFVSKRLGLSNKFVESPLEEKQGDESTMFREIGDGTDDDLSPFLVGGLLAVSIIYMWMTTPNYSPSDGAESFVVAVQPNVPMDGSTFKSLDSLRDRHVELSNDAFTANLERMVQQKVDADTGGESRGTHDEYSAILRSRYAKAPKLDDFPESPLNFANNIDREFQHFIGDFARRNSVSVLFNSAEPDAGTTKYFNSAVMVGPDGKEAAQYDKIYLLPFGEAVPRPLEGILPGFVGNFAYGREYDILPVGDAKAGVMICFESHFGALSREYVRNGADVLIEMTNDGYLGPTPVLRQHLANAVFRAVETNRPVLRVTNVGITAYINERGQVLDEAPSYQEATRVWSVSKSDGSQTFYVKYGDWFAWLCTIVTIGLLGACILRRKQDEA